MLTRFSLYGFLKNQRYFEPFLILILLEKGFSFSLIGLLIGFRELVVNLLEIPSGVAADVWSRRRSLLVSFVAYVASFLVFAIGTDAPWMFGAMLLYAVGDSFRSGSHKAMIFSWLEREGRVAEKTRIYGFTRSWSKFGSAISVLIGAGLVLLTGNFSSLFYASIVPYSLGIANLLGYPAHLDVPPGRQSSPRAIAAHMLSTLRESWRSRGLRRLILESMGFEGAFHATKDYLQPVLMAVAVASTGLALDSDQKRTALYVAPVYFVLFLGAGFASRRAHFLPEKLGGEKQAAGALWTLAVIVFSTLLAASLTEATVALVIGFVVLHLLQNLWRPVLISRFHDEGEEATLATVLSIESQAKRVGTMVLAPLVGAAVDFVSRDVSGLQLWPVGALGLVVALGFVVTRTRAQRH